MAVVDWLRTEHGYLAEDEHFASTLMNMPRLIAFLSAQVPKKSTPEVLDSAKAWIAAASVTRAPLARRGTDIFEVQDRIAAQVAGAIHPAIRHAEIDSALRRPAKITGLSN